MSDEQDLTNDPNGRRRRRRRRRRRGPGDGPPPPATVEAHDPGPEDETEPRRGRRAARRTTVEVEGPVITVPATAKNPFRKRTSRARRAPPGSAATRRRQLTRTELEALAAWLGRLQPALVGALYRGLGGQPDRVGDNERMIQLAARAIAQGARLGNVLKSLHERDRQALSALLQAGGIAHHEEFRREMVHSYGGHDRDWHRIMTQLAEKGLVFASEIQDSHYFYVVPEVLADGLTAELVDEMRLPTFQHDDVRVLDAKPFCPPLDFSIATLATYVDQRSPRLTQRHDIYRHDQEAMDAFFAQIWEPDGELFAFHLDFLMMHGMVELKGEYLALNRDVVEEWLQLEPEDQRDLLFRALDKRMAFGEWVLWAVHEAKGAWVGERPLMALYRRWKRGEDWRSRYQRRQFAPSRTADRDSFTFSPLVRCGLLELGQWGQEKFYRLTARGLRLLDPPEDDGFTQFYLTPSFEIMAPAGLAPVLLFRIGEIAQLYGCDRANTYKITEPTIDAALERGWRRDDILQFLRDNSQIGLPDNVELTLKGWIGHRGDVEFHDLCLMTVHRSQIRRLEANRRVKPYLLHRFAPGMYAVDRSRKDQIYAVLREFGFDSAPDTRSYPGDPSQVEARQTLHRLVADARGAAIAPASRGQELARAENLQGVPGTRLAAAGGPPDLPPEVTPEEIRSILDQAITRGLDVEMVYLARTGEKLACRVQPQRLAFKTSHMLVALDRESNEPRSYQLDRIERLRAVSE